MKNDLLMLAKSLRKYANYLKRQNEVVFGNHEYLEPVRDLVTSTAPQLLPLTPAMKVTDAAKFEKLTQELTLIDEYQPLLLNEILPTNKREQHRYLTE